MRQYEEPLVVGHLLAVEFDLLQESGADGPEQKPQHGAAEHRRRLAVRQGRADGGHVAVAHPPGADTAAGQRDRHSPTATGRRGQF